MRIYDDRHDDDERGGPLRDGERVSVPMALMDHTPRYESIIERDVIDAGAGDDDGDDDAGTRSVAKRPMPPMPRGAGGCNAWKNPAPAPAKKPDGHPLKAAGDAAAMRASARAAWERKECATLGRPRAITHGAQCQGFERAQGV